LAQGAQLATLITGTPRWWPVRVVVGDPRQTKIGHIGGGQGGGR